MRLSEGWISLPMRSFVRWGAHGHATIQRGMVTALVTSRRPAGAKAFSVFVWRWLAAEAVSNQLSRGRNCVRLGCIDMTHITRTLVRFITSEDGPTATEYAVMLALIIVLCIGAISGIGNTVSGISTTAARGLPTGAGS